MGIRGGVGGVHVFLCYAFLNELKSLLEKARSCYSTEEIERLTMRRKRPRRVGKSL